MGKKWTTHYSDDVNADRQQVYMFVRYYQNNSYCIIQQYEKHAIMCYSRHDNRHVTSIDSQIQRMSTVPFKGSLSCCHCMGESKATGCNELQQHLQEFIVVCVKYIASLSLLCWVHYYKGQGYRLGERVIIAHTYVATSFLSNTLDLVNLWYVYTQITCPHFSLSLSLSLSSLSLYI